MTNRPATFRQSDVTRAAKGALAAGLPVARMEIDREGKIVVIIEGGTSKVENDWD